MMQKTILKSRSDFPSDKEIQQLSEKVKQYLTDKRYVHTLSVADEAVRLGKIYLPDDINRLRASALLHDITKKADYKKQLQYCEEFGIMIGTEGALSVSVLHAKTAAGLAKRDFPEYVDEDILAGIRSHTTGRYGMTVFEAIIYLADYIEPTRKYQDCIDVRNYFYDRIQTCENNDTAKYEVLCDTMIYSLDFTISSLLEKHDIIDSNTIRARNYFISQTDKGTDE